MLQHQLLYELRCSWFTAADPHDFSSRGKSVGPGLCLSRRHPHGERESDMQASSGEQGGCAVSKSSVSFYVVESRFRRQPQRLHVWRFTCRIRKHPAFPCSGERWFIMQTERTRFWNIHHTEQWFFFLLKLPALEHSQKGLWRVQSCPLILHTGKACPEGRSDLPWPLWQLWQTWYRDSVSLFLTQQVFPPGRQNKTLNSMYPVS